MAPDHVHNYVIRQVEFEGILIKVLWTCYHGDEMFSQWEYFTLKPPTSS